MATIKAHTLSGFMELLPAPQTQMERLLEVLRSSYGVYGFTPLDTPIIEASDVLLAKGVARRALISAAVKKGAQNVKNSIRDDLKGSGNKAFRSIPITYTVSETPGRITAEIGPTKGGAGSLANIAFFGTAKGGGTHAFYEHAETELPPLAEYVGDAADDMLIGAIGL